MMLVGLTGSGKTQLIHSLLDSRGITSDPSARGSSSSGGGPAPATAPLPKPVIVDPIQGATDKVEVVEGVVHGIRIVCVDTPGLVVSSAAVGRNSRIIQQIKGAYRRHRPDLVVYVDRIDSGVRTGGELPVLQALTQSLGSSMWLNTIIVLSHAGAEAPCNSGPRGPQGQTQTQPQGFSLQKMPFETFAEQRSTLLQQIIRGASGDSRLMNPTAYVDSHPQSKVDAHGASLICNGMAWKSHLYLMIVSAKLLADTEGMLQSQDGSAANKMKQQQQLMEAAANGGSPQPRQLPLPYLVQSLAQFSRPLDYPDQGMVLEVRSLERLLASGSLLDPKDAREVLRQIKGRLMQIRQANSNKERMQLSFKNSTLAGGKVTPEPPPIASKRAASVHPPGSHRYRVPEPSGGWLVRPHIEAHSMEASDGIEGLYMERSGVFGRKGDVASDVCPNKAVDNHKKKKKPSLVPQSTRKDIQTLLGGSPFRHNLSCQVNKESFTVQSHSEVTLYHDALGTTTTALSADVQTSTSASGQEDPSSSFLSLDSLVTLRGDLRRQLGAGLGRSTLGLFGSHMTEGGSGWRLDRGPTALGIRAQHSVETGQVGPLPPSALNLAVAAMSPLHGLLGRVRGLGESEGEESASLSELCMGGNGELSLDLHDLLRLSRPFPVSLTANGVLYKGDVMTGLGASCHYEARKGEMVGGRVQVGGRGKQSLGVSLKVKSQEHWWAGIIAMAVPLSVMLKQSIMGEV